MTIEEIDKEILRLTKLKENIRKESIVKNSQKYIGQFYIPAEIYGCISIGKIIGICEGGRHVICNEITLYQDALYMESDVIYSLEKINITSKENVFEIIDKWINKIKLYID